MPFTISRRGLLASAGAGLIVAGCGGGGAETAAGSRHLQKIGLQMYTLRDPFAQDPQATVSGVADIGYDFVELAQLNIDAAGSVERLAEMLSQNGLDCPSIHLNEDFIVNQTDEASRVLDVLGARYAVVPWLGEQDRTVDGYQSRVELYNRLGRTFNERGQRLAYHNHWFEWDTLSNGMTGADYLYGQTDPDVVDIELDMFWAVAAGIDIPAFCEEYSGRIKLAHVKDRDAEGNMVNVGEGVIDWSRMIDVGTAAGIDYFIVEHDNPPAPAMESVAASHAYAKKIVF